MILAGTANMTFGEWNRADENVVVEARDQWMRSALLPGSLAAAEIARSWRHLETIGVLGAWAIVGLVGAQIVLRRMARRESGSRVSPDRQRAAHQRV